MSIRLQPGDALRSDKQRPRVETNRTGQYSAGAKPVLGFDARQVSRALGWFSVGLGLAEFLAPRGMASLTGINGHSSLIRSFGMREMASGFGILRGRRTSAWLWGRVAGDAMDLATLGAAMGSPRASRTRLFLSTAAVAGVAVADVLCAQQQSATHGDG